LPEASGNTLDYSPPAPRPPAILKWSLRILVLASIGLCIDFDVNRLFVLKKPDRIAAPYKLWDGWITDATAPGRGLFLKFDHFPPGAAGYAQNIYFRAVYVLYPRPLLVAGPSIKLSNGDELLKNNEYPGDQWLRSQGVDSVMTIQMDPVRVLPVVSEVRWLGQ
jgi:hypothetical protein